MYADQIHDDHLLHTTATNPNFSEMELQYHHCNLNQLHLLENPTSCNFPPYSSTTTAAADNFLNILPFPSTHPPPGFLASLALLPPDGSSSSLYNSILPPQTPFFREPFLSVPDGNGFDVVGGIFAEEEEDVGKHCHGKHQTSERHRRVLMTDKYEALRKLVPNPTKNDRASIIGDAIDYINELKSKVTKLEILVEKKRAAKERVKRPKLEEDDDSNMNDPKEMEKCSTPLRSSWLHRKSKNTEVDVRIMDDEVTVKLVQQKRMNCLLFVSKVLDEFQLDLHHVAGGLVGDYYSFLFNSKISEGSSIVYASAVASKVIEVVDKLQCEAILPVN